MERWTRRVLRHRRKVLAAWFVLFLVGAAASANVGDLLSNRFTAPGTEAEDGRALLADRLGEKGDGDFTLVVQAADAAAARSPAFVAAAEAAGRRAAGAIEGAKVGPVQRAGDRVAYLQIPTPLDAVDAREHVPEMRRAIGSVPGARTYLSGFPAMMEDTEPIYNEDLARGEAIAIPIALLVLAFMFGTLAGIAVPVLFAAVTLPTTIGIVWIAAHFGNMAQYVVNIVTLIGLAIAIDYSMLVVFRFREELRRGDGAEAALMRTMATAGRATLFSGLVVALGLALLVVMPLPFMRSMGVGGLAVPLVSIAAAATFLPAILATMGDRIDRFRIVPRRVLETRALGQGRFWTRLARSIMRRPLPYLLVAAGAMVTLALVGTGMSLTGGDNRGVPKTTESTRGLALLEDTIGPGALVPNQIVIDTGRAGGAFDPQVVSAERRLVAALGRDPEVERSSLVAPVLLFAGPGPPGAERRRRMVAASTVDRDGRVLQVRVAGRSDAGTDAAKHLVERIRDRYLPDAGFREAGAATYVTGAPAFGVDIVDKVYGVFPWLVAAVLVLSYLLLLRAFRSVFLPLKAVAMNVLSVGATYGVLVLVFQSGWGSGLGFEESPQVEFWIPVFLFAMLFGLSMDYEVFLLSRMREEWDKRRDNEAAVAFGLEHTGRIITAAAIVMVAAFSGFMAGSFYNLQQFGVGLAAAIFLDATVVRAVLVPAFMKVMGDWNWFLPDRVRRALRLAPASPAIATPPLRRGQA
ncbi:MAG TPA: MMPL family transporter [Thermoleophilaceae bacterium]|jgi:RND superfamily putative drug exporter